MFRWYFFAILSCRDLHEKLARVIDALGEASAAVSDGIRSGFVAPVFTVLSLL